MAIGTVTLYEDNAGQLFVIDHLANPHVDLEFAGTTFAYDCAAPSGYADPSPCCECRVCDGTIIDAIGRPYTTDDIEDFAVAVAEYRDGEVEIVGSPGSAARIYLGLPDDYEFIPD